MDALEFDLTLAQECANAFACATQLGCQVSGSTGEFFAEFGYGCESCRLCGAVQREKAGCVQAHVYGMTEAERFGGKYIYYCPLGLTCFVSPILGEVKSAAKITVGPFLMVEKQDYIDCELSRFSQPLQEAALQELARIPVIPAAQVNHLSTLLFMAVGFMNNVSSANRNRRSDSATSMQGQVTEYIQKLKNEEPVPYPIDKERALLRAIQKGERNEANRFLNEILGHLFFSTGYKFALLRSRVYEILVLMGRVAIDAGAGVEYILSSTDKALQALPRMNTPEELCIWLCDAMINCMDAVFQFADARHAHVIHRCVQYIETHYHEKVSLENLARQAYLSSSYLSRIFKQETGVPFQIYLGRVRVGKSKELLRESSLKLADIAAAVGFEDQSYFTKVFKQHVGITPNKYRSRLAKGSLPE